MGPPAPSPEDTMSWNLANTDDRIRRGLAQAAAVNVQDLDKLGRLDGMGQAEAWRVLGAHAYVELLNLPALLDTTTTESERAHKRLLRYLHLYQGIAARVLDAAGARAVDFQDQRLHFLVATPMGDGARQMAIAVTVADALRRVLRAVNSFHGELPDVRIRVGIDHGMTLAVRNGTRGDREALFLGNPANRAAKLLEGGREGIYLGDGAWDASGLRRSEGALGGEVLNWAVRRSGIQLDVDALVRAWEAEMKATPLADFQFTRPRPPLASLELETLTPANARRLDCAVLQADIDGYTAWVADRIFHRHGEREAVRALHVIRRELRDVLQDFGGRKIRYIGDCLVGVLTEGAAETDRGATLTRAALCAGALRSSFNRIHALLPETVGLGLAIGMEAGPVSLTRLGPKGRRFRCTVGQAVIGAGKLQGACDGRQTALGSTGFAWATPPVRELLPAQRPVTDLDYNRVHAFLQGRDAPGVAASVLGAIRPRAYGQ